MHHGLVQSLHRHRALFPPNRIRSKLSGMLADRYGYVSGPDGSKSCHGRAHGAKWVDGGITKNPVTGIR